MQSVSMKTLLLRFDIDKFALRRKCWKKVQEVLLFLLSVYVILQIIFRLRNIIKCIVC